MANISTLNTVYNHYMTSYAPQGSNTKYDTHKKSELRGVYNSIVKMNKESPLFMFDNTQETKEFAVTLKESARSLKNTISSLSVDNDTNLLSKKTAYTSNDELISANFIGSIENDSEVPNIELQIDNLATKQENQGTFLNPDEMSLPPDTYSFDIRSRDIDYEFQFNINEGDTNKVIQDKLSRLITRSNIGVTAETVTDEEGNTALKLTSDDTGRKRGGLQFIVSDNNTTKRTGAVKYFGLDNVSNEPIDANFKINGESQTSPTNRINIAEAYDITFKGTTGEDESISIGLKTDVESLTDNISHLIMGYNEFMQNTIKYLDSQPYSKTLAREMTSLTKSFGSQLESIGINLMDDGQISLDGNLIQQTAEESDALERFSNIKSFANTVYDKVNAVSLDPMQYAQKTVVAYKNPGRSYSSPYITSNYSGMMFSSYC